MINISLLGSSGKMGKAILNESKKFKDISVIDALVHSKSKNLGKDSGIFHFNKKNGLIFKKDLSKNTDLIIDFSNSKQLNSKIKFFQEYKKPVIFCSTGINKEGEKQLHTLSKLIPIFIAPNTSKNIFVLAALLKDIKASNTGHISISETHHKSKLDRPSGTAIFLANQVGIPKNKIKVTRGTSNKSIHKIKFILNGETIEIKHSINDRKVFAEGALKIAKWFYQKPKKLYHMQTFVEELNGKK